MMKSRKNAWLPSGPATGTLNQRKENDSSSAPLRKESSFSRKSRQQSPYRDRRPSQKPTNLCFQKVEDSRQEHALRRYKTASEGYCRARGIVQQKCGKGSDQELLMDIGHLYRVRLENADMLQRALIRETQHVGDNTWEISLRNTWTMEPQIGDLYGKPQALLNPNAQNDFEFIGYPLKKIPSLPISHDYGSRQFTRHSRWSAYEHFMEKCEKRLARIVPHKPDFLGFQVVGSKVVPRSAYLSNIPEEDVPSEVKVEEECLHSMLIVLITPPPVDENGRNLYARSLYGNNAAELPERSNEITGTYAKACVAIANKSGLPVIDLWSIMQETQGWQETYLSDGLHLTPDGNAVVYEQLLKILTARGLSWENMEDDFPHHSVIDEKEPHKAFQGKK